MTRQTFTVTAIDVTALTASDLREEAEVYDESSMFNSPWAYRITIYDDQGQPLQHMAVQALLCPPYGLGHGGGPNGTEGRLGIAWGADATWADAESIESGIEMGLHEPEEWAAKH